MRVVESLRSSSNHHAHFSARQMLTRGQVGAVDEVHGEPRGPLLDPVVIDGHDAGVFQRCRRSGLACEPFLELWVAMVDRDQLQRLQATQVRMLDKVDLPHSALPDHAQHPIPGEPCPGFKIHSRDLQRPPGCGCSERHSHPPEL